MPISVSQLLFLWEFVGKQTDLTQHGNIIIVIHGHITIIVIVIHLVIVSHSLAKIQVKVSGGRARADIDLVQFAFSHLFPFVLEAQVYS